jgi:hypothetical protein
MTDERMISASRQNAVELAFLLLTVTALLLRLFVPNLLLDLFVSYTSEGGNFLVKFHLAAMQSCSSCSDRSLQGLSCCRDQTLPFSRVSLSVAA